MGEQLRVEMLFQKQHNQLKGDEVKLMRKKSTNFTANHTCD